MFVRRLAPQSTSAIAPWFSFQQQARLSTRARPAPGTRQAPPRTSPPLKSKSNASKESNARRDFENENHLGRACSKFQITAAQEDKWRKALRVEGTVQPLKLVVHDDLLVSQPGYEMEALAQIHERSYNSQVLLEIRDVRVPASSHHPSFTRLAAHRLHLICYTHADAIDQATRDKVEEWTAWSWPDAKCIFVDTRENRAFASKAAKKEKQSTHDNDAEKGESSNEEAEALPSSPYDMVYDSLLHHLETRGGNNAALTVGVANTGKSSLLMALIRTARLRGDLPKNGLKMAQVAPKKKKGKTSKKKVQKVKGTIEVEDRPGKTRVITEYLLRAKPRAFFLDVPGMTPPKFFFKERPESWFAMGASNLLPLGKSHAEDVEILTGFCAFVLYAMNRDANFGYVAKLRLDAPTQDLEAVLEAVKPMRKGTKDPERHRLKQCQTFLKLLNTGNFGPVILDDLSKPYEKFVFKDVHFQKKEKKADHWNFRDRDFDDEDAYDSDSDYDDDDEDSFYKN